MNKQMPHLGAWEEKVVSPNPSYFWQVTHKLAAQPRGFHCIQHYINSLFAECERMEIGFLHIFLQHTSASLCISENTCSDVATDLENWFDSNIPDSTSLYRHNLEGPDDMPAHIKNSVLGSSLCIPIQEGKLALGTWQGVYLCEHRDHASGRNLILTAQGIQCMP